jgi:hypothetical protein
MSQTTATLIAHWEKLANAAQTRMQVAHAADPLMRMFYKGMIQAYRQAASELREANGSLPTAQTVSEDVRVFDKLSREGVLRLLARANLNAANIYLHADGAATAIFPRLHPLTNEERIAQLQAVDARLVILDSGRLRDSGDPFVDFALIDTH